MKQPRKYSKKNKKKITFIEMESLRQQIENKTEEAFEEWIEEQGHANANSEGNSLSNRQKWLKSVEK